jgi:hypothetical protein
MGLAGALCASATSPVFADSIGDEFDDAASLASWTNFEATQGWPDHLRRAAIVDGVLEIEPWTSGWYAEFHAPFLHREITGDFVVTARIAANGLKSEVPTSTWSLAGLMVREPRAVTPAAWEPRAENWLFITTGVADRVDIPVYESKTTVNSRSNLKLRPAPSGWVEVGVARLGPSFFLLVREDGKWRVHERFHRMDLPRTVQVGLVAYTDWDSAGELQRDPHRFNTTVLKDGKPDLKARVDWVRHKPLRMPPGRDPRGLTDHAVPEADVLALLDP